MHGYPMSEIYYLLHDPDKVLLIFFFLLATSSSFHYHIIFRERELWS